MSVGASRFLDDVGVRLPPNTLVTDSDVVAAGYETDITGRFSGSALAVARPRTATDVETIVKSCASHGIPLVPQGGNTGLVGGGVPRNGELLLSMSSLDHLGEIDRDAYQVEVGAGATLATVQRYAAANGLELRIDHPARDSATIGGMVATNAGGPLALGHGSMRASVVGLAFVHAQGVVRRMNGLLKDNAGYDLAGLLVGSEGTLGVITAARLRLEPALPFRLTALFGLRNLDEGLGLLRALRSVPGLEALDFFDSPGMELVRERKRLRTPLPSMSEVYTVAQWAGTTDMTERVTAAVDALPEPPQVVAASDTTGRQELWAYREGLNESIRSIGIAHKLDVGVPIAAVPECDRRLRAMLAERHPDWRLYIYGHLGDGNLHVNIVGPGPDDEEVDDAVLHIVAELGGTISAEHGIGRAKRRWLHLCRSPADIAAMRGIKRALDPAGVLSPGRLLPDAG